MSDANADEEDQTPGWLQLVLFPFILFEAIRQLFAARASELKHKSSTHQLPTDWRDLIPGLRDAEWSIFAMKAEGARRILSGGPLDLDTLRILTPDSNQLWIPPNSAQQMHLRILALNTFHADLERFIYRHAERIRRAAERGATTTTTATTAATTGARARAGQRVRAPP